MIISILIATLIGVLCGVFTGLVPSIHVNLLTILVVSLAGSASGIAPLYLAIFIVALAVTHSFLSTIPSVYLGAPEESTVVAVLPGHQLFLQGHGHKAVLYTLIGSLGGLVLTLLALPIFFKVLVPLQVFIGPHIGKILFGFVVLLLVLSRKFFHNVIFFGVSGLFGLLCFGLVQQQQVLLPMLSGLFGTSTLLLSLTTISILPRQKLNKRQLELDGAATESALSRSTLIGILASFFPGLGASQGAILASSTTTKSSPVFYLLLVGGISTVNFVFSLLTLTLLDKARNGAVLGMQSLLGGFGVWELFLFSIIVLVSGGLATLLGIVLSRRFALALDSIPYKKTLIGVMLVITALVIVFSGLQGIIILATATALGILAQYFGAQKNMLLGCLLLPVMFYLW